MTELVGNGVSGSSESQRKTSGLNPVCAKRFVMPDPRDILADDLLLSQIERGSRVLDLGCGDGRLIARLKNDYGCSVLGVERDEEGFVGIIERGLPAIRADLNTGLHDIPDGSFDFAVLSQTLQQVSRPMALLNEIFRIANRALVVVPNFGHWKVRLQVAWGGRAPVTSSLPYEWYESPNVHFLTMRDFRELAARGNFRIIKELPIIGERAVDRAWGANLRAHSALYVLERAERPVAVPAS
jgi:methionine biosynthesis protein MetW